ncbi:MAG: homocysteine S-methyltransferase family protein [Candidatus Bipolaricaulia bacterium]
MPIKRSLRERLDDGGVVCAEGYLFELERRGLLQAGAFVPEVTLENPEALAQVHREFVWAGSDIIEAFTYYGHREKLRLVGKEELLEPLNRGALQVAHRVANEVEGEPPLVAGNICNTNIYDPEDEASWREVRAMFDEMVAWAVEEDADLVIAETFYYFGEARLALDAINAAGLPAVVTFGLMAEGELCDGWRVEDACRVLEDEGAEVTGMNCFRGPATMWPHLERIRERVSGDVAALPVPYRTTEDAPTFFQLADDGSSCGIPGDRPFPTALDPFYANRYEIGRFAHEAYQRGINYLGVCCGASPIHIREVAEALGRTPPASRYAPDLDKHFLYGTDPSLKPHIQAHGARA